MVAKRKRVTRKKTKKTSSRKRTRVAGRKGTGVLSKRYSSRVAQRARGVSSSSKGKTVRGVRRTNPKVIRITQDDLKRKMKTPAPAKGKGSKRSMAPESSKKKSTSSTDIALVHDLRPYQKYHLPPSALSQKKYKLTGKGKEMLRQAKKAAKGTLNFIGDTAVAFDKVSERLSRYAPEANALAVTNPENALAVVAAGVTDVAAAYHEGFQMVEGWTKELTDSKKWLKKTIPIEQARDISQIVPTKRMWPLDEIPKEEITEMSDD
jgi:hypothetical protein